MIEGYFWYRKDGGKWEQAHVTTTSSQHGGLDFWVALGEAAPVAFNTAAAFGEFGPEMEAPSV